MTSRFGSSEWMKDEQKRNRKIRKMKSKVRLNMSIIDSYT